MKQIVLTMTVLLLLVGNLTQPSLAQTTPQIAKGNCKSCAASCQKTLDYCVQKKGPYAEGTITNALKDCVTACKMCAEFLTRGSEFSKKSAALCIDACNNCAKTCDGFKNDSQMKSCTDECRKCAGNCEKVASAAGP